MFVQVSLKTVYEIIALPVTIRVVRYVERKEDIGQELSLNVRTSIAV